jgi:hypothetical protein
MPEKSLLPEDQIMQWMTTKWIAKPIHVISELGIADLLADGPKSVESLAKETETHAPTLFRILRALSSVGVFVETEEGMFGLSPLSRCLVSDGLRPIARMFFSEWHDKAWSGLSQTVRTGEPGFDHAFGKPAFEWFEENPVERSILDQGQGSKATGFAKAVIEAHDFSNLKSVCDIGGGQGTFLMHFLAEHPHVMGYVADLPGAVASAEKVISKANMDDRCKAIPYDFFKGAPPECDGYFLVNVLHNWDDENCVRILSNIKRSMDSDSRLWIVEYIIESGLGFCVAKLLDLEVLVMGGGRERTIEEYKALLSDVGLHMSGTIRTERGPAIMECLLK